jgi:hypothetical protein
MQMSDDAKAPKDSAPPASTSTFGFSQDPRTAVFICAHVAAGDAVLYVSHDQDGDWQFLCGRAHEDDLSGGQIVCLEHVVAADPSLNKLSGMCADHFAERADTEASWSITDRSEEFIRRCIEEVGWSIEGIPADDEGPAFAYTIGLKHSFEHPELIVFGLPPEVAQSILNEVGQRISNGERFDLDKPYGELLENHPVRFRKVRAEASFREFVGYALWFYRGQNFELLQLLWPDRSGRFPDASDAADGLRQAQPLIA